MARRQKKRRQIKYFDYSLLFIIIFLICFGLVMLYSTSAYDAQLTFKDPTHYLKRQGMAFGLGLVIMFVLSRIDYRYWNKLGGVAYLVAIALCTLVQSTKKYAPVPEDHFCASKVTVFKLYVPSVSFSSMENKQPFSQYQLSSLI